MKVYVLQRGEDYYGSTVVGVFTTKEGAESKIQEISKLGNLDIEPQADGVSWCLYTMHNGSREHSFAYFEIEGSELYTAAT